MPDEGDSPKVESEGLEERTTVSDVDNILAKELLDSLKASEEIDLNSFYLAWLAYSTILKPGEKLERNMGLEEASGSLTLELYLVYPKTKNRAPQKLRLGYVSSEGSQQWENIWDIKHYSD